MENKSSTKNKEQIKELAMAVDGGLTVYIAVHNAIFRESATFKSFVKNLFGRGVPMSKLLEDSERLLPLWEAIHEKTEFFQRSTYSSLTKDEKYYFDLLSQYVDSVRGTVAALVDRQRLMNEGSKGGPNNPMTRELLKEKEKVYEMAVQKYLTIGRELNAAAAIIFQ